MAILRTWVEAIHAYIEAVAHEVVTTAARALSKHASVVDGLCPRWGDYVNDTTILDDAAKVALLYDARLQELPHECRSLHAALSLMAEVAERLRIAGGADDNVDIGRT